jgi:hypothetical protein
MLAAPILIKRSTTNYCAGVSGKGNRIELIQDGCQIKRVQYEARISIFLK